MQKLALNRDRSLILRVLLPAKIVCGNFQDVPERPGRERDPETQHLRQHSADLPKLADGLRHSTPGCKTVSRAQGSLHPSRSGHEPAKGDSGGVYGPHIPPTDRVVFRQPFEIRRTAEVVA